MSKTRRNQISAKRQQKIKPYKRKRAQLDDLIEAEDDNWLYT